jgi:hypothetical protein
MRWQHRSRDDVVLANVNPVRIDCVYCRMTLKIPADRSAPGASRSSLLSIRDVAGARLKPS